MHIDMSYAVTFFKLNGTIVSSKHIKMMFLIPSPHVFVDQYLEN